MEPVGDILLEERAGIWKMRDEGRKAVGRRQVEVYMVTPATV
jgi:hypothetical protein